MAAGVRDSAADHACSHLGKAVALATLLRGTSHHAQRRAPAAPRALCQIGDFQSGQVPNKRKRDCKRGLLRCT